MLLLAFSSATAAQGSSIKSFSYLLVGGSTLLYVKSLRAACEGTASSFLEAPGETFDWLPVTSSHHVRGLEGSLNDSQPQRHTARAKPLPSAGRTSLYRRAKFNINDLAYWLTLASIPLRNFCRLADFLQYYFWGEQGKSTTKKCCRSTALGRTEWRQR